MILLPGTLLKDMSSGTIYTVKSKRYDGSDGTYDCTYPDGRYRFCTYINQNSHGGYIIVSIPAQEKILLKDFLSDD